jgi:hypothetical protein
MLMSGHEYRNTSPKTRSKRVPDLYCSQNLLNNQRVIVFRLRRSLLLTEPTEIFVDKDIEYRIKEAEVSRESHMRYIALLRPRLAKWSALIWRTIAEASSGNRRVPSLATRCGISPARASWLTYCGVQSASTLTLRLVFMHCRAHMIPSFLDTLQTCMFQ